MTKQDRLLTLKEAVIYSNRAEENIRLKISKGQLKKYDKHGFPLSNPLRKKGFVRLSELKSVYNLTEDPAVIKDRFFARKQKKDSVKNVIPESIIVLRSSELDLLNQIDKESVDCWILNPSSNSSEKMKPVVFRDVESSKNLKLVRSCLNHSKRILNSYGNLLIHSIPRYLPYYAIEIEKNGFLFKYWICYDINTKIQENAKRFIPEANGILYYVKSSKNFRINRVRVPYQNCLFCSKPLKDYGGKKHLRHVDGMVISDIWHVNIQKMNNSNSYDIPLPILRRLVDLSCSASSTLLLAPYDGDLPNEFHQ